MSNFIRPVSDHSQSAATSQLLYQKHPPTFASHSDSRFGSRTDSSLRTRACKLDGNFGGGTQLLRWAQAAAGNMSSEGGVGPT